MTFKELKEECIKAIGYDPRLSGDSMGNLSFYLSRINGSIKRAFDRMLSVGALEEKCVFLEEVEKSGVVSYDINSIINGIFKGFKSLKEDSSFLLPYAKVNDRYYLYRTKGDKVYVVYYEDIGDPRDNDQSVRLDDKLIRIIPYYVKGELIEDEEPSLAVASKNTFEMLLDELIPQIYHSSNKVKTVYEVEE